MSNNNERTRSQKVAAFDIDDTLFNSKNDQLLQNTFLVLKRYFERGWRIYLITARLKILKNFTQRQLVDNGLHHYLDITKDVYYTNGRDKVKYLKKLDVDVFYDDNSYFLYNILKARDNLVLKPSLEVYYVFVHENDTHFIFLR